MKNRKAQSIVEATPIGIILFIVLAFVAVFFLGIWGYTHGVMTDALVSIPPNSQTGSVNISKAADDTFGEMNRALISGIKVLSIALIIGMVFFLLIANFFLRDTPPALLIVDVLVLIFAIILAVYISNRYEAFLTGEPFSSTLLKMKAGTSIILNLPRWTAVVGILTIIFSYLGFTRRRQTSPLG